MRVLDRHTLATKRVEEERGENEPVGASNKVTSLQPLDPSDVSRPVRGGASNQARVVSHVSYGDWRISFWLFGIMFVLFGLSGLFFFLFTANVFSVLMMVLVAMGVLVVAAGFLFH